MRQPHIVELPVNGLQSGEKSFVVDGFRPVADADQPSLNVKQPASATSICSLPGDFDILGVFIATDILINGCNATPNHARLATVVTANAEYRRAGDDSFGATYNLNRRDLH